MTNVIPMPSRPEAGHITLRSAEVIPFAYWRFYFCHQSGISIWTDDPIRMEILAPGQMEYPEAKAWAKRRVPDSWELVGAVRDGEQT